MSSNTPEKSLIRVGPQDLVESNALETRIGGEISVSPAISGAKRGL
jgi:hypothetical protein